MAIVLHPRDDKFVIEIGTKEYGDHLGKLIFAQESSMLHMSLLRKSKEA
jgi:hypothetical protein